MYQWLIVKCELKVPGKKKQSKRMLNLNLTTLFLSVETMIIYKCIVIISCWASPFLNPCKADGHKMQISCCKQPTGARLPDETSCQIIPRKNTP